MQGLRPQSVGRQAETGLIPNEDPGRSSGPTAPCWAGGPHGRMVVWGGQSPLLVVVVKGHVTPADVVVG